MHTAFLLPYLEVIKWIFISQFFFIGVHVIFSFILKPILTIFSRTKEQRLSLFEQTFMLSLKEKKPWSNDWVPCKLQTISFLIPLILKIDKEVNDYYWNKIKKDIFQNILFPEAKKFTYARSKAKKAQAVACYLHCPDIQNEEEILHLLQDPIPIIKYSSASSAAKIGTARLANAIIDEMNCSRFLRHPFREAFLKGNSISFSFVEKRLEVEVNPFTRVNCLEVLAYHMNDHILELLKSDLSSSHKNLRIAAIRALGHYPNHKSIELLLPLLKDGDWEVRAISARSLGYISARQAIPLLTPLLKDQQWWVRFNAAIALKRLGEEGMQILKQQSSQEDRFAYEISQYVLNFQTL